MNEYFCPQCNLPWVFVDPLTKEWVYGANLKPQTEKICPNCYLEGLLNDS